MVLSLLQPNEITDIKLLTILYNESQQNLQKLQNLQGCIDEIYQLQTLNFFYL